jgi:hypothetical protein
MNLLRITTEYKNIINKIRDNDFKVLNNFKILNVISLTTTDERFTANRDEGSWLYEKRPEKCAKVLKVGHSRNIVEIQLITDPMSDLRMSQLRSGLTLIIKNFGGFHLWFGLAEVTCRSPLEKITRIFLPLHGKGNISSNVVSIVVIS